MEKLFQPLLDSNKKALSWDMNFCIDARFRAMKSKDPSSRIGAVIVTKDHLPVTHGFNGIPRGVDDTVPSRNDREQDKYSYFEHAERNAIFNAAAEGSACRGTTMYVTDLPCSPCAGAITQSFIDEVIVDSLAFENKDFIERWSKDILHALIKFQEKGVNLEVFDSDTDCRYSISKYLHITETSITLKET